MITRRQLLSICSVAGTVALAGCGDDGTNGGGPYGSGETDDDFTVTSSVVAEGEELPETYTADGEDISPPLSLQGLPGGTESLAVVLDDPDAPSGVFVHWLLWNVPGDTTAISEGVPRNETVDELDGARQGTNDFGEIGYFGPAPPADDDAHTYRFTVYAVDSMLELEAGAERDALEEALDGSTLGSARLTSTYER